MEKRLLSLLEKDARYTNSDLAELLNISEEEIAKMVDSFKEKGIIKGYQTIIDWNKAIPDMTEAMIEIKVTPQKSVGFDKIAEEIAAFPEVRSVSLMSGGFDLAVTVRATSMKEVAMFVGEKLSTLETVQSTATHFFLNNYKLDGKILFDKKKDEREFAL